MADRERKKSNKRSRSYSSEDERRKSRSLSKSSSRNKKSRKHPKKSRSRSRSLSSSRSPEHKHKLRGRTRSSSSSTSRSEERKCKEKKRVKKSLKRRKSRSSSRSKSTASRSSSSSGSSSDDSEYERKKTKKFKHKATKKKKKSKKIKKKEKKTTHAVNQNKYGKYGILSEADQFSKQPEFYCWLQEVKLIDPELVPRLEIKRMFETFMEDYNTATFPHKKYYNLAEWEMKHAAKKRLKQLKKAQKNPISFADDESNHTMKFKGEEKRYGLSKEKILEMKRAIKERTEQEYKKNVGFEQSARK